MLDTHCHSGLRGFIENTINVNISQIKEHNEQEQISNKAHVGHKPEQILMRMFINMNRRS